MPWSEYLERWDATDRSIVLAVLAEQALVCQGCGTAGYEWDTGGLPPYLATTQVCQGCAAKDRHRTGSEEIGAQPGSSVRLVLRDRLATLKTKAVRPKSPRELAREVKAQ